MAVVVAFFVGLISIPATGGAATVIDSDITEDTTWGPAGSPYTVVTFLDIQIGATLTIEAGVLVKFDPGYWLNINNGGALVVNGTPGNEVVFTSSAVAPAPGDWGYIYVTQGGSASIERCEISYAGHNSTDALRIVSTSPVSVSHCDIHDNLDEGIQIDGGAGVDPTITNTTLRDNGGAAAEQGTNTGPSWTNITMSGNGDNSILLTGDYSVPVTLDGSSLSGGTFKAVTGIDIGPGGVLTVAAGTTLTFDTGEWLNVNNGGSLEVDGAAGNEVVFTSSAPVPAPGDWGYIYVAQGGTASIERCEISYAGDNVTDALRIVSTSPVSVSYCDIHNNLDEGIQIEGGAGVNPTITDTTLRDNGGAAAEQGTNTGPSWTNITISGNGDNSILLTGDYSVPVTLDGSSLIGGTFKAVTGIDIGPGGVLTFAAGTTLTFDTGEWLNVNNGGSLEVDGAAGNEVVFTSSAPMPAPGDWGYIYVAQGGTASIDQCEISYAGNNSTDALRIVSTSPVTVSNCDIHDNLDEGIQIDGGENVNPTISDTTIRDNGDAAAEQGTNTEPTWTNITISGNADNSILLTGGYSVPVTLDGSSLIGGFFKADTYVNIGPGGVLTIAPGTTLTFDTGRWLNVNNGGELVAIGTRELPVAFTSSQATPAPGDWQYIAVNAGGTANFWYCEISYAGSGLGALRVYTGESMEIYACDFHHNFAEALALGSGADVSLVNSLLHNNGAAAIQVASNSALEALNNTIAYNDVGFEGGDATVTLVNNLIAHNTTTGVESDPGATLTIQYNDVFNPGGVNFVGIPDPTGSAGNISVNPVFLGTYFGLADYSPVIDAGTSNGTPQADFYDRPRRNHPNIPNTGGGSRPWYDMGAIERFCLGGGVDGWCEIFIEGFESGDTSAWSREVP